jgi:hypothetical protein
MSASETSQPKNWESGWGQAGQVRFIDQSKYWELNNTCFVFGVAIH